MAVVLSPAHIDRQWQNLFALLMMINKATHHRSIQELGRGRISFS